MSDEIPGGVVIDPDEQPAAPPPEPQPAEAAAPAELQPEDEFADVQKVDLRGETLVPLSALKAEREKAKHASAEVAALRPKAQQLEDIGRYVETSRPYIEALKNRPDLMAKLNEPKPEPDKTQPILPPEKAEQLARTLELYTPEGQPDIKRAQVVGQLIDDVSAKKAQQAVEPALMGEATRLSVEQFQRVAQAKTATGQQVDPTILRDVWTLVPPQLSSRPDVAAVLYRVALAEQVMRQQPKPAAPPNAPLLSEAPGGRAPNAGRFLSAVEQKVRQSRGLSEKEWAEKSAAYKPGQANVLED